MTGDRDRGDRVPYPGAVPGVVARAGKAEVHYLRPGRMRPLALAAQLERLQPGGLCLNGFFARTSRNTLLARKAGRIRSVPVVLAPRGDFSPGALALKRSKKRSYLWLARAPALCRGVIWHASSEHGARDIRAALARASMFTWDQTTSSTSDSLEAARDEFARARR